MVQSVQTQSSNCSSVLGDLRWPKVTSLCPCPSLSVSLLLFSLFINKLHNKRGQGQQHEFNWGGKKCKNKKNMHSQCSQSIKRDVNWLKGTRLSNFRECLWLGLFHLCGAPCHRATLLDVGIDTVIFKDQIVSGPGAVWTWFTVYKINLKKEAWKMPRLFAKKCFRR